MADIEHTEDGEDGPDTELGIPKEGRREHNEVRDTGRMVVERQLEVAPGYVL
jgi:hypothetical protein